MGTQEYSFHVMKPTFHDVKTLTLEEHRPSQKLTMVSTSEPTPWIENGQRLTPRDLRCRMTEACDAWMMRSPSLQTRDAYTRDLECFFSFICVPLDQLEALASIRPNHIAAYRDHLLDRGLVNSSVVRKITVLRSLFSYLQTYGYTGKNPAHSDFVAAPTVPRDGKTVGLTPEDCRRLIDVPDTSFPVGIRDRAILSVLAYSACRVGELVRLRIGDYRETGGHKVLEVFGKGGKERRVPIHAEAVERLEDWLSISAIRGDANGPLFRGTITARGKGSDGFNATPLSKRAIQALVKNHARMAGLDSAVTVHSLRVTALTTARERGADIIDLQDFAGHADPRTTLTYIRTRDRLSKSPTYVLRY
jgi:integrase/recombinase XerD